MAELSFGDYRLAVDVEATRAWYAAQPQPWIPCDCAGCRNFAMAAKTLPLAARDFFTALGVNPEQPGEVWQYDGAGADRISGGGWYPLIGVIQSAKPAGENQVFGEWICVTEHLRAAFQEERDLPEQGFPTPCFQMNIAYENLPWVLEEPNPYVG